MPNLDHLLDYSLDEHCLTEDSSALLKAAFKEYFQTNGVLVSRVYPITSFNFLQIISRHALIRLLT